MVVTLIGYRGSGKSTVAAPLAERLGWDWTDSDIEIERRAGKSIREIFQDDGEPVFRQREHDVLADLLSRQDLVIAAGGGAILNEQTRRRMKSAGLVVWLTATVETLLARITGDPTTRDRRPNLTDHSAKTEIETVLTKRLSLYEEAAHRVLAVDQLAPDKAAEQIAAWVTCWPAEEPAS